MEDYVERSAVIEAIQQGLHKVIDDLPIREETKEVYGLAHEHCIGYVMHVPAIKVGKMFNEYCKKRCLVVITADMYHFLQADYSRNLVEVVRCKNCGYAQVQKSGNVCQCKLDGAIYDNEYYCAYGSKKDGGADG